MNIFENILNRVTVPVGKQPTQTPIIPQAPIVPQKNSMTLFSDEQQMFQKMKADNLSDEQSFNLLKKRRSDLLGGNTKLAPDEQSMLLKMQADNLSAKQAVAMIQKRRQDMETKASSIHDLHADEGVVEQTLKAPFRAIGDVVGQTWQGIGKGTEGLIDASFRGVNDLNRMIGSSDYSPELEKQLPQGGYLGDVAKIGAGTTSAIFNLGKAPLALGINTANQLPGAQYITQGIGKGIQYGAEQFGGMAGLDKGTSMDIATTGMNLLGMKPGMNTLQYGKGIANAQGVMGKAGAIVNPVGESVVQTVKMPYDIAKGTYNLAKKLPNPLPKGADISTRANRFTAGDEGKFIAQIKETPGEFATSRGMTEVGEKAIEKAQKNFERSKAEADIGFDTIQGKFSTKGASNDIIGDLLKANKEKMNAQPRNKDSAKVDELLRKYESGEGLTMSEINEAKRIHARNHTYSYEQRTSNEARNASDIQNDIRDWQFQTAKENGFTNADKVNMETKGWKMYADSLAKKMDRSGANNAISITDWIALSGGNPTNIALFLGKKAASSNLIKTGAIKLFSKKTKPSIIEASKADIQQSNFLKNVNRGVSGAGDNSGGKSLVRPVGLLPAPSGKATGAKNVRVNQPTEKQTGVKERVNKEKVKRPGTASRQEASIEKKLVEARERENMLKNVKNDITSATKAARYGGTGNTRVEAVIDAKLAKGEITQQEALSILDDVKTNPRYEYIDQKALDKYIEKIKGGKVESFDELIAPKPQPKEIVTKTHKQIYDKLNQMANDGRYGDKSWNDLADEFKKVTGKDIMDTSFDDFGPDGMLKLPKKVVAPKKKEVTPIVKKEVKKTDITGIEKEIETARKAIEMDKSIVKESARDDYVIFTKKGGTKENEGIKRVMQLKDFTNGRDGGLMKGYGPTDGNILAIVRKDGSVEYPKSPSPKPIVKNLQKTEKSIGDMETKKLIEEARKYKSAEEFADGVFGAEKGNTYKNVPKDLIDNEYLDYFDNKIYFKQKIDKGTVESWKERIKKGERPPIKIDDTNGRFELGDGYHRYQAYKELGFEKIPVFYKSELLSLFNKIK